MNRQSSASNPAAEVRRRALLAAVASLLLLAATPLLPAATAVIEIGTPATPSRVPPWDVRGLGPLPWQAVACLDMSEDGERIAVGTIAPAGDANLFLLDSGGKIVGQHRAGNRWLNEVVVSDDGRFTAALSTTPQGTAGDTPRFYAFRQGKEPDQISGGLNFQDFRPARFMFHYGNHSNHLPRISRWAGSRWVVAGDDVLYWLSPTTPTPPRTAHLGQGVTTAMAASAGGLAVVGRCVFGSFDTPAEAARGAGKPAASGKFPTLLVVKPDGNKPIAWSRPGVEVAPSPAPEEGVYGPPAPPYDDVKFQAPLAVAIDSAAAQIAVADYQGWQRVFHPRDGSADIPFGTRFMPSRPTICIYTAEGQLVRRVDPEAFAPFWCDLSFSADGRKLLIWPHNWTSRGLAGQSLLPADDNARDLYVLDIAGGGLQKVRFPDAIVSVAAGGDCLAVGCWDHKVYLLDQGCRPIPGLPGGLDVGAASLVRVSKDGRRIVAATTIGTVWMLAADGKECWWTDLNKAATPGDKPWTRNQKAEQLGPGVWRTNGGLAHSDMGSQILVEAQPGAQRVPVVGCPAEAEPADHLTVVAPTAQVVAGRPGVGRGQETSVVPLGGLLHGVEVDLPALAVPTRGGVLPDGDTGLVGQSAHRVDEVEVLDGPHETDGVALGLAPEAVVEALLGVDAERGRLLAVEGAQALPPSTHLLQRGVLPDQSDDVGLHPDPGHVLVGDAHGS